jgi:hypothetical protein
MVVVRLWAGLMVCLFSLFFSTLLIVSPKVLSAPPTYWWMTVAIDTALTSIFISRMVLHLRVVASPHGTLVNGGHSTTGYSHAPVFTAASISTKPTSATAAHQNHRRRDPLETNDEFGDSVAAQQDSMWTVPSQRHKRDEEDGRYDTDEQTWEMDVVRTR